METVSEEAPSLSSAEAVKGTWHAIWKLQVPNRIRLFMWHAGSDSLPARVNLARHKILTETIYSHCKLGPKDTLHALWMCPLLSIVWQVLFADLAATTNSCSSFLDVIQLALHDKSCFALFAWTTSLIWLQRNKLCREEDAIPLTKISSIACEALQDYHQLHPIHAKPPRTTRSVRWRPPPASLLKVNFDGGAFC